MDYTMKYSKNFNERCTDLHQSWRWGLARCTGQNYAHSVPRWWLIWLVVLMTISMLWAGCATVASPDEGSAPVEVSEAELSRLLENAGMLRDEALKFEVDVLAPDQFAEATAAHNSAIEMRESDPRASMENAALAIVIYEGLLRELGFGPLRRQADQAYSRAVQEFGYTTEQLIQLASELGIEVFPPQERLSDSPEESAKVERGDDKERVMTFIEGLYNNRNYYVLDIVDERIKQHNPLTDDGVVSIKNSLEETWFSDFPEYNVNIKRIISDGNLVFVQSHVTTKNEDIGNDFAEDSFALVEIYRLEGHNEGRRIVEHWDVMQPVSTTSVNGNSMFDGGGFEAESRETEIINKRVVLRYMMEAINNKKVDVLDEIMAGNWIAHNPTEPNGRENLKNLFTNVFFTQFPDIYADVKRVGAEGNLVFVQSHYTTSKEDRGNDFKGGGATMDIFRLEGGIITEHWDAVMRPIPETTASGRSLFDGGALYNYKKDKKDGHDMKDSDMKDEKMTDEDMKDADKDVQVDQEQGNDN